MSPLQPSSNLQSELNSGLFWIDHEIRSALYDETFRFFENAMTGIDGHLANSEDHLPPPEPDYGEWLCEEYNTLSLADATPIHEASPPVPTATFTLPLSTLLPYLPIAPAYPSPVAADSPYSDCTPQASPSSSATDFSSPPTSPPDSSPYSNSPKSDDDSDYAPPSEDEDEYIPAKSTYRQKTNKSKATTRSKSPRPAPKTMKGDTPRGARRSNPYDRNTPSRNLQCKDTALLARKVSDFKCPICGYTQQKRRVQELKRHIRTHGRWRKPGEWTCRGVGIDRAHLLGIGIRQGMTEEEFIEAGGYRFEGRLMAGGCRGTFSRKDALKRHVDSPGNSCVNGDLASYRSY